MNKNALHLCTVYYFAWIAYCTSDTPAERDSMDQYLESMAANLRMCLSTQELRDFADVFRR